MSWFQLDPQGLATRAAGRAIPGLGACMVRGAVGFCLVSVLGFIPWAVFGRALGRLVGEAGMYGVCALVFIGVAGLVLHPLILGTGSLGRFYRLFAVAFGAYSVAWIGGWMALRGHAGSLAGLLAGTTVMGWIFTRAFEAPEALAPVVGVLFVSNAVGYFVGGWVEGALMGGPEGQILGMSVSRRLQMRTAMLSWGVFYGLGLGAGLGFAFHRCQARARTILLRARPGSLPA